MQGQTFGIQRILQFCQAREFKEGEHSMIRHVVFPQPRIAHITRPLISFSKTPELYIPKLELECAITARLLALNSNSKDKSLGTFLSATETVGLDEDLPAVISLLMQIKLVGSPLKQERDSNKDSIAIYNHVVSNEPVVLNTVDNKDLVLISIV